MDNALSSGRIPDQLLNNVKQVDCVLFLGADLPREVTGLPSRADLAREVAQRVSQAGNRFEFTDFIRNALDTAGKSPSAFQQGVVQLAQR